MDLNMDIEETGVGEGIAAPKFGDIHSSAPPSIPPTIPLAKPEVVDVGVGTSDGRITEPEGPAPCGSGTSVTLQGTVWQESEGILAVKVNWRGKNYVGTLLDCTNLSWAPPQFRESPTTDLNLRTPKGREEKRRDSPTLLPNDMANYTVTRRSFYSKHAAGDSKGQKGPTAASPTPFATPKVEPTTSKRKAKSQPQPASPVLFECPEPNCSKKYRQLHGLKYHQSHAHRAPDDEETKESLTSEKEQVATSSHHIPKPTKNVSKEPMPKEKHQNKELQERPIKSPIPKVTAAISLPSSSSSTPVLAVRPLMGPRQGKAGSSHHRTALYGGNRVLVGPQYQAKIPPLIPLQERHLEQYPDRAELVWSPHTTLSDDNLDMYINIAKEKYGCNSENVLEVLFSNEFLFEQAFPSQANNFLRVREMWLEREGSGNSTVEGGSGSVADHEVESTDTDDQPQQ